MKIFMISRGYPSKRDPQWGCFEKDQAEALQAAGHEVVVLSVDSRFRWYYRPLGISHRVVNGIHVWDNFLMPGSIAQVLMGNRNKRRFKQWQLEHVFKKSISEHGIPDILYAHYMFVMHETIVIKKKYNIPLVGIEHWSEMGKKTVKSEVVALAKETYPYVDQLIAVSESLKNNIKKYAKADAIVVHNMVGQEFTYSPVVCAHPLKLVAVGSLIHRKGFDLLIQALDQIRSQLPADWQCNIIGEGNQHAALQQQIDNAGLTDHMHLLGQKNKQEIVTLLQQSDFFVLPSRSDTFGVVYIEAMACGLPVIATDCGVPSSLITSQNGLFIPVDDVNALSDAIIRMTTHLAEYNRQAIAQNCQERFAPKVIAQQLTQIFEQVIARK